MERSQEHLKKQLSQVPGGGDLVDTIFGLFQRVRTNPKRAAEQVAAGAATVIQTVATSIHWSRVTSKPETFPPDPHTHPEYLTQETDPTVPGYVKTIVTDDPARVQITKTGTEVKINVTLVERSVTVSDVAPSGTPADGDVWVVIP